MNDADADAASTNVFARFRFGPKRARGNTGSGDGSESAEPQPDSSPNDHANASALKKRRDATPAARAEDAADVTLAAFPAPSAPRALRSKWQERWHGICDACFAAAVKCTHHNERLLRLLIVGHNPSDHAWQSGYSYSNPTNRMWKLIVGQLAPLSWRGILPAGTPVTMQNAMPHLYGVGFTSIGLEPGNDAAKYSKATMAQWKADFFQRLRAHAKRVCENQHGGTTTDAPCTRPHGPLLIAFSGKRQFSFLFSPPLSKVESYGLQTRLPQDWPHDCIPESEVWVLPSSSGRSALTHDERATPYRLLADRLHTIPWPFDQPHAATEHADTGQESTIKSEDIKSEDIKLEIIMSDATKSEDIKSDNH